MRGKVAKALRKEIGFVPKNRRIYRAFSVPVMRDILQWNTETQEVSMVRREVEATIIECTSGDRKLYQYLKRKYKNFEHEETLRELPTQQELRELETTIALENAKKEEING